MKNLQNLIPKNIFDEGGRCGIEKGEIIKSLVLKTKAELCVEIGVFKGSSLMYFTESVIETGGKIFGIDPYTISALKNEIPDRKTSDLIYNVLFKEQETLDNIFLELVDIIKENNLNNYVEIIRDTSENCYKNFKNESIDVLHIDGNHDEEFVTKDILNYLPLVKKNGYIIMDDINWPGVKKSIENHLKNKCDLIKKYTDFAVYLKK
jgi:predicted O-methyltransferase YrrM